MLPGVRPSLLYLSLIIEHEMITKLDQSAHVACIRGVWSQSQISVGYQGLLKGVDSNDTTCRVVERVSALSKIRAPTIESRPGEVGLDKYEHVRRVGLAQRYDLSLRTLTCRFGLNDTG